MGYFGMVSFTVCIVLPDLRGGGAERVCVDLANEFVKSGYSIHFALMQAEGELVREAEQVGKIFDLKCTRMRQFPPKFKTYLKDNSPDVILVAMWPLTVLAPFAQRLSGHRCTVVVSEHGMLSAQYRDWGRLHGCLLWLSTSIGYRLAQHRVGVSSGLVQDMAGLSWMRRDRFHVIHNPIPPRPAAAPETIKAVEDMWGAPRGARIVTVGSMKAVKNHPLLLRAFARLNQLDARLMFVGDGKGRDALLSLAHELGVADRVILAGFHTDPTPFYMTADLFALSSDYEGFGNVIVEAMACGTPVVSTDCPSGPAEILENGRWGLLTPVGDAQALAETMNNALNTTWDAEQLRERAADFAPAVAAQKYLNLFESP
jgi:glycosyltransferase involved in cell wall biosynthesis